MNARSGAGSDDQWQISADGGIQPRWSPDGKELYYIAPDGTLMDYGRPQYDVSAGGRFLINTTVEENVTSPITLLLNWKPPVAK